MDKTQQRIAALKQENEKLSEQADEPKAYCPHCGRAFERSDWGLNYDSGLIEYACPECDFVGTEHDVVDRDKIECDLMDDFDTVTQEDIQRVIDELEGGEDYETALETVRNQIRESED